MLRGVFYLTFLFSALFANSQIVLKNFDFEDSLTYSCSINTVPSSWYQCGQYTSVCDLNATEVFYILHPSSAFTGLGVCALRYDYNSLSLPNAIGKMFQKLDCPLINRYQYSFSFWNAGLVNDYYPNRFFMGQTVVSLGMDSCADTEVVYESSILDTIWRMESFLFTPSSTAENIYLSIKPITLLEAQAMVALIDALSPIYVVNAHELEAVAQDTLFYEKKQECISLSATESASMDSVWWEQVGVGVISQQLNAGVVCVDSNTTFIVHGIGTDSTCAGYLPSSDTVRVRFYDPTSSQPEFVQKSMFKVYPNPAKDYFTIEAEQSGTFELFNSLGQLVLTKEISKGSYATLDVSGFGSGVYFYNFLSDGNADTRGKLVKE